MISKYENFENVAYIIRVHITETYRTGKAPAEHVHPIEGSVWYLYPKIFHRHTLSKTIQGSYTILYYIIRILSELHVPIINLLFFHFILGHYNS
jgi:hypothetical protein